MLGCRAQLRGWECMVSVEFRRCDLRVQGEPRRLAQQLAVLGWGATLNPEPCEFPIPFSSTICVSAFATISTN